MGYQNFFATRLATDIGSSDTTITLETAPSATSGRLVLEARNASKREIIEYTNVSGSDITGVTRGVGGTSATDHIKNSLVEMNLTAEDLQDILDAFDSFAAANSNGWTDSVYAPTAVTYLGNRSYQLTYASSIAGIKSVGMRSKFVRTVAAPDQCTDLESGSSQYYSKSSPAGTTFTDDFCAGGWVKLESYVTNPVVIGRANGTEGWLLYIETDGRISLAGYNGALTNYSKVSSYQSLPLGKWVHVAAQLDMSAFTATSTTSYIMIDGVDVPAAVTRAGTNPTALVQAGNLEVGGFNGGTNPFDGKLAQVFYSSAKITQANIRTLISQGLTSALITTHSIVSAYSFDNSINDLNTTNANNLTAQNSAVATDTDSPFGNSGLSTTVEYAITTAISSDGLTETVQVPEGCALPTSGGITSMAYSPHKVPHGFPAERGKWSISRVLKTDTNQSSPVQNTWYNLGYSMSIPVGAWSVFYEVSATAQNGTNPSISQVTLSTANNTESDKEATSHSQVNGSSGIVFTQIRNVDITLASATTYYLNLRTTTASGTALGINGSNAHPSIIKAECAYL